MWLALLGAALASDAAPHFSYPKLVTANGYGAVIYSADRLADAYPHLYQQYDAASAPVPEVLYDTYWGWVSGSGGGWWNGDGETAYAPDGTGVIEVTRPANADGVALVEFNFAPMGASGFGLAQVACVMNAGASDSPAFSLVSLHNWHVGGTEVVSQPDGTHVTESGSDLTLTYEAPGAASAACSGVYDAVNAGVTPWGSCAKSGGDVVPGFVWNIPSLAPTASTCVGTYTAGDGADGWVAGRDPSTWLSDELAWWADFHARGQEPAMADDETAVYRQALAFLKMAQVREEGAPYGQIPASLPLSAPVGDFQHIWNITWVRDGSYAAAALARAGYTDEAADALRFMIQPGTTGDYRAYVGDADYAVSVCRLYGNGDEWSDSDANGPNVEFDNFGLFLWALGQVGAAGGDDVVAELGPAAFDGVADVLVGLVDPLTGLLYPDSSIWERHWNGHQQQFTYSSAWAVAGLRAAADMADSLGDSRAATYRATADTIAAAIPAELLDSSGVLAASREQLESGSDYLDLAAVEAFNHGILDLAGPEFEASVDAWDAHLAVATGHGYKRNDDGDTYDEHEWIVIDLRLALALRAAGRVEEAAALEQWVTDQAMANHATIPELYSPSTADYAGPAPMLGFGSGAYVYNLLARDGGTGGDDTGAADDTGDPTADDTGRIEPIGGCGCSTPATNPVFPGVLIGLALVATLRRSS